MIGALIGVGVASNAGVQWGYVVTTSGGQVTGQNGLGSVIASFAISPLLAGILGFIIFCLVKYVVLERKGVKSFYWALAVAPLWYALVGAFEAWLITWKSPRLPSKLQDDVGAYFLLALITLSRLLSLTVVQPEVPVITNVTSESAYPFTRLQAPPSPSSLAPSAPSCC